MPRFRVTLQNPNPEPPPPPPLSLRTLEVDAPDAVTAIAIATNEVGPEGYTFCLEATDLGPSPQPAPAPQPVTPPAPTPTPTPVPAPDPGPPPADQSAQPAQPFPTSPVEQG